MELADQQVSENEGLSSAEIPAAADVPAQEKAPAEKLSLRDTINKSVETVRTEEAKRVRDAATGKFTKSEKEAGAIESATPPANPKPEQNAQPDASKPSGPPSAWKSIWENLSPEAQALAVKREADVEKGFEEYRTKTAQLQEISQALEPVRHLLQQGGIQTEAQAVKRLLEWEGSFRNPQTRIAAFHNLARQYGVDFSTLVPSSSGAPSPAQDSPDNSLRPVIDQFGQQLNDIGSRVQTWEQNQIAEKLSAFAQDKPHFEKVRSRMGALMNPTVNQHGQIIAPAAAANLDDAYQQATWADPEIRQQMLAEQEKKRADELARTNAEKIKRASLAAVSPSPRPPNGAPGGPGAKKANVRDSILSAVTALREEQRA